MFTRRSDVLYAKIRRGGMSTDMPNFGTLFTAEETWALVDYLWSPSCNRNYLYFWLMAVTATATRFSEQR